MSITTAEVHSQLCLEARVLQEGYGPGAWHGPDLKAALDGVDSELAFWRPGPRRHNIAEIALHHAYCVRGVRSQLSGESPDPFVLTGDDWFELNSDGPLSWTIVRALVADEQERLAGIVSAQGSKEGGRTHADADQFERVLGITCHAIYHAGQVQLIKRLAAE